MRLAWFLALFLLSGGCGLVYETVWLRLSMGSFGVTAPSVSLFLSIFMAGLGLGSWAAGALSRRLEGPARGALRLYALCELFVAAWALAVPSLVTAGRAALWAFFGQAAWGSMVFYAATGALLSLILLPGCLCMGATYPFAMAAIERLDGEKAERSFSYLYAANVIGAACGALAGAFVLIELLGFSGSLRLAAALNCAVAAAAFALSFRRAAGAKARGPGARAAATPRANRETLALLFTTGLVSMAMEVVWIRQFTPFLGTTIYTFAFVLAIYLVANFAGSCAYRAAAARGRSDDVMLWTISGALSLLPVAAANPYLPGLATFRALFGLAPLSAALGYLTPALVDRWSGGDPDRAGGGYAVNMLGCIVGPLVAGFALLPFLSGKACLAVLSVPLFGAGLLACRRSPKRASLLAPRPVFAALAAVSIVLVALSTSFEQWVAERYRGVEVLRDYQADVVAGDADAGPFLLVNGKGMTMLGPITKVMAHLPLAMLPRRPRNALVICFGMGTTFRSLLSWDIPATAVELVPSIPRLFGRFHPNDPNLLQSPNAHVVIDDGRRFLARSAESFDVITVDPAPPLIAAGTSLLYSKEFYGLVKRRLAPGGIMQQWFVKGLEPRVTSAFAEAIRESFPYTRVYQNNVGYHVLASMDPIPDLDAKALAAKLPPKARVDLVEYGPMHEPVAELRDTLRQEIALDALIVPNGPPLVDDRPVNEYYFVRVEFPRLGAALEP